MTQRRKLVFAFTFAAATLAAAASPAAYAGQHDSAHTRFITQTDRLIVKYKDARAGAEAAGVTSVRQAIVDRAGQQFGATLRALRATAAGAHVFQLNRTMSLADARTLAAELKSRDASIDYAEPGPHHDGAGDADRPQLHPAVGPVRNRRRHQRARCLGQVDRQRHQRGRDRYRLPSARGPGRPDPARLRLHHQHDHGQRRRRPRQRRQRSGRLDHGRHVRVRRAVGRREFELARHPRGRHHRRQGQQRYRHRRHRLQREDRPGARAGTVRRLHLGHRRRHHLGLGRHRHGRAGQRQQGARTEPVAGRQRQLRHHHAKRDQRRARAWGGGGRGGR